MDSSSTALLVGDLAGVAVFAAAGGSLGVAKRLDLFGVAFVGFVAALGGGIIRDLVIDKAPLAFYDWRYGLTAAVASMAVFWWHARLERMRRIILLLDASGLALFTVTGTIKALEAGVPAMGSCLIGMLTGIGGGLARDLLLGEIPVVLQREIYASAALIGAAAVAVLTRLEQARRRHSRRFRVHRPIILGRRSLASLPQGRDRRTVSVSSSRPGAADRLSPRARILSTASCLAAQSLVRVSAWA